jgi:hypothetical protein
MSTMDATSEEGLTKKLTKAAENTPPNGAKTEHRPYVELV